MLFGSSNVLMTTSVRCLLKYEQFQHTLWRQFKAVVEFFSLISTSSKQDIDMDFCQMSRQSSGLCCLSATVEDALILPMMKKVTNFLNSSAARISNLTIIFVAVNSIIVWSYDSWPHLVFRDSICDQDQCDQRQRYP